MDQKWVADYVQAVLELFRTLPTAMYFFSFCGGATLYILNRLYNRHPFSLYRAINIPVGHTARPFTILCDIFLSSAIGTIVVVHLTGPQTIQQAIAAGLGMTGILSALSSQIGRQR